MKKGLLIAAAAVTLFSGCASKITSMQKNELEAYKSKGLYIEEKSTGAAVGLGLLPGGGSFYTENYGLGVVNLLLWPASILWDPVSGHNGAEMINYHATKHAARMKMKQELTILERELEDGKIEKERFLVKKRAIEDLYNPEMM